MPALHRELAGNQYRAALSAATVKSIATVPVKKACKSARVRSCSSFISISMPRIMIDSVRLFRLKPRWIHTPIQTQIPLDNASVRQKKANAYNENKISTYYCSAKQRADAHSEIFCDHLKPSEPNQPKLVCTSSPDKCTSFPANFPFFFLAAPYHVRNFWHLHSRNRRTPLP